MLLAAAGFFWWQGRAEVKTAVPNAPMARGVQLAAPMSDPPQATAATREEKRFARYDKDKNGLVGTDEYFASRKKAFAKLDVNRDGWLSFDEWALKTREKFVKADADRSKALSPGEFATTAVVRKAKAKTDCPPPAKGPADEDDA